MSLRHTMLLSSLVASMSLGLHAKPTLDDLYAYFSFDIGNTSDYPSGDDAVTLNFNGTPNLNAGRFDNAITSNSAINDSSSTRNLVAPETGTWSLSFWFKTGESGSWSTVAAHRLPYSWPCVSAGTATGVDPADAADLQKTARNLISCGAIMSPDPDPANDAWNGGWSLRVNKDKSITFDFFKAGAHANDQLLSLSLPNAFLNYGDWVQVTLVRTSSDGGDFILYASAPDAQGTYQTQSARYEGAGCGFWRSGWGNEFRTHSGVTETNGAIDDLASWRIALAEEDVRALAQASVQAYLVGETERTLTPDHLYAYFPLDADAASDLITGSAPVTISGTQLTFGDGRFSKALTGASTLYDSSPARDLLSPLNGTWSLSFWFKTGESGDWFTVADSRLPYSWPCVNAGAATGVDPADADALQKTARHLISCGAIFNPDPDPTNEAWNKGWSLRVNKDKSITLDFFNADASASANLHSLTVPAAFAAFDDWVQVTLVRTGTVEGDAILYASSQDSEGAWVTRSARYEGVVSAWRRADWGGEFRTTVGVLGNNGGALDELASWRIALSEKEIKSMLEASTYKRITGSDNPAGNVFTWFTPGDGSFSGESWTLNGSTFTAFTPGGRISLADVFFTPAVGILVDAPATARALVLESPNTAFTLSGTETISAYSFTAKAGTLTQNGANLTITAPIGDLTQNSPLQLSGATYTLAAGTLTATGVQLNLGATAPGTFNQSGGTLLVKGIGATTGGSFTLTGGSLILGSGGIGDTLTALNFGAGSVGAIPGSSWTSFATATLTDPATGTTFAVPFGTDIILNGLEGPGSFAVEGNLGLFSAYTLPSGAFIGGNGTLTAPAFTFADGSKVKTPEEDFLTISGNVSAAPGAVIGLILPESIIAHPLPVEGVPFLAVKGTCGIEASAFVLGKSAYCKAAISEEGGVTTTTFSVFKPLGLLISLY